MVSSRSTTSVTPAVRQLSCKITHDHVKVDYLTVPWMLARYGFSGFHAFFHQGFYTLGSYVLDSFVDQTNSGRKSNGIDEAFCARKGITIDFEVKVQENNKANVH
jgi:hypothetical protein